jgi:phage tail tape-measure protein
MSEREDQHRRDAAAIAETVGRELDGVFQPVADHARRVRDMAGELTLIASRNSKRVERHSGAANAADTALAELVAFAEVVRSLAGEVRAMAERSVHDLDELKGHIVHTVRSAALGRQDRLADGDMPGRTAAGRDSGPDE